MRSLLFLIPFFLITSCKKEEEAPSISTPIGLSWENLPVSKYGEPLSNLDATYLEVLISEDSVKLHHAGTTKSIEAADESLKKEVQTIRLQNKESSLPTTLLISASADLPFGRISKHLQNLSEPKEGQLLFLTKSTKDHPIGFVPLVYISSGPPILDPVFLRIDEKGMILGMNIGKSGAEMDVAHETFPDRKLVDLFSLLTQASKSAGIPPILAIRVHPDAKYQRFIDLISILHNYSIVVISPDILPDTLSPEPPQNRKKPSPPWAKPLPSKPKPQESTKTLPSD